MRLIYPHESLRLMAAIECVVIAHDEEPLEVDSLVARAVAWAASQSPLWKRIDLVRHLLRSPPGGAS